MNPDALKTRVTDAAKSLGISFNVAFHQLVMERFLARLAISSHQQSFIFKGGFLLSHYVDLGRDTRDLDFLITQLRAERPVLERTLSEIATINAGDEFVFTLKSVADLLHDHMKYNGFRATFSVLFGKIKENLEIDIGVGDAVSPHASFVKLMQGKGKPIFEDEISLMAYPPETILAEKLQTAVLRAAQNSRMKDYFDILIILRSGTIKPETIKSAILRTFAHRQTSLDTLPLCFSEADIANLQRYWTPFFRGLRKRENIPAHIGDVIATINNELIKINIGTS